MALIADILLAAGAIGAGLYCFVLGRRLKRFNNLENGVGGAVAVLSAQVDDLTKTLTAAQSTAGQSAQSLTELTTRAEACARQLELHMASLHDLPAETARPPAVEMAATPPEHTPDPQPEPEQTSSQPMFVRRRAEAQVA
jgi:hypothetical protein